MAARREKGYDARWRVSGVLFRGRWRGRRGIDEGGGRGRVSARRWRRESVALRRSYRNVGQYWRKLAAMSKRIAGLRVVWVRGGGVSMQEREPGVGSGINGSAAGV